MYKGLCQCIQGGKCNWQSIEFHVQWEERWGWNGLVKSNCAIIKEFYLFMKAKGHCKCPSKTWSDMISVCFTSSTLAIVWQPY